MPDICVDIWGWAALEKSDFLICMIMPEAEWKCGFFATAATPL